MADEELEPNFVIIVRSRYGGVYEPGEWIAFPMWPEDLPPDWKQGDVACASFFADRCGEFGGGDTPQAACDDLLRILRERRPGSIVADRDSRREVRAGERIRAALRHGDAR